jgi:phage gp36-like protein
MNYATAIDLAARLAPALLALLADDDADGAADEGVIEAALEDASAMIDQALGGRYAVPLADPAGVVRRWCVDLATMLLFQRRREALPREHAEAAALTRRTLESIAGGLIGLAGAQPVGLDFTADATTLDHDVVFDDDELGLY